jgi:hypothetical protein
MSLLETRNKNKRKIKKKRAVYMYGPEAAEDLHQLSDDRDPGAASIKRSKRRNKAESIFITDI